MAFKGLTQVIAGTGIALGGTPGAPVISVATDQTAADVAAVATVASGGATGKPADAGHAHTPGSFLARVQENQNTVAASGAAQALPDVTTATIHDIILTANCTLTFPAVAAGKSFLLVLTQDATGSRIVTWPANILWAAGSAPALTTVGGKTDILSFICVDGTRWLGIVVGQNF